MGGHQVLGAAPVPEVPAGDLAVCRRVPERRLALGVMPHMDHAVRLKHWPRAHREVLQTAYQHTDGTVRPFTHGTIKEVLYKAPCQAFR